MGNGKPNEPLLTEIFLIFFVHRHLTFSNSASKPFIQKELHPLMGAIKKNLYPYKNDERQITLRERYLVRTCYRGGVARAVVPFDLVSFRGSTSSIHNEEPSLWVGAYRVLFLVPEVLVSTCQVKCLSSEVQWSASPTGKKT